MDDIENDQHGASTGIVPENLVKDDNAKRGQAKPLNSVGPESEVRGGPEAPED